jgi:hypothetical protein
MRILILSFTALTVATPGAKNYEFPADFMFGAATASYQIEGAWDYDGEYKYSTVAFCCV